MKKLFIGLAIILTISIAGCGKNIKPALAEPLSITEQLQKLPALKQGVAYSLLDNDFSYLSTVECLNWKGISLEAGYSSKDKLVGVISYQLLKLKDLGVNLPILNLIEFNIGAYGGFGRIALGLGNAKGNNEWDTGISATLISLKW